MRPITAQPGHTVEEVEAALASRNFVFADCYTIIPKIGDPLRYTIGQSNVSVVPIGEVARQTYRGNQVVITGLRVKNTLGVEVDEQQIEISYPDEAIYQASLTWPQAFLQGRLDGASIRRDRYIAQEWGGLIAGQTDWLGGMPMFLGLVSTLNTVGRMSATISVKSDLVLLNRQAPAFLWEPGCKNTWGDPACGVVQSDWAVLGTVGSSPSRTILPWASSSTDYNQGKIHITNGDTVTRVRTIARATATELMLAYPLDFDPVAGMEFTAYPGCSRTDDATTGCPKYHGDPDWRNKFKGFPFVPVAETGL